MLITFLELLAGGIMLAAAIPDPRDVTLNWLRLSGILALVFSTLPLALIVSRGLHGANSDWEPVYLTLFGLTILLVLVQLGFAQVGWRLTQRLASAASAAGAIASATMPLYGQGMPVVDEILAFSGVAAMCGIALMDMLIGHAYLTASKMTMAPFRRLNLALAIALILRVICNVYAGVREPYWGRDGLLIGTRWLVGLLVPAVFVYMAHDCIRRRATQSATGILYVAGVSIFIGEIIAMQLVRDTGLPF